MTALIHCAQLVTLSGPSGPRIGSEMREIGIIPDGAMIVDQGRIDWIGSTGDLDASFDGEVIDCSGKVVLPGFVDAHTHPVFGGNRVDEFSMRAGGATYQEIAAAGGGIRSTVAKTRAASDEELFAAGSRHARWFLENGTTTVEAKSGYGLSLEDELRMLRVIRRLGAETPLGFHPTFLGAHAFPSDLGREEYLTLLVEEMLPRVAAEGLARWCDIFVESNYFTAGEARRVLGQARSLGLGLRMHVDQLSNGGGAALAAELGAKTADHLEQTDSDGVLALREAGVQPVLLPGSVYCLGLRRYPDARAMIDAGLAVVLATDFNPGSSPSPSIPFVMSLACTQMKMTPEEALTSVTMNAACSLDLGQELGSLEVGKRADITIWPCSDWREIPYFVGALRPERVFVGGVSVH